METVGMCEMTLGRMQWFVRGQRSKDNLGLGLKSRI